MRAADQELIADFRARCAERRLAVTHQRVIIYQALMDTRHHPSPEEVYRRVRRQIPSISLGTVYKNIKTFIDHGLLREASPHHGCARLEVNLAPHHHLVCLRCKAIMDLDDEAVEPVRLKTHPPAGFQVERCSVEVLGICEKCSRHK
jgi:Fur family transcriptional regulator, peroxide stress response regulator